MGNAYRVPPNDALDELSSALSRANSRLTEVEAPSGSQVFAALAKVKQLILDLPSLVAPVVTGFLSGGFTTGGMHSTGNISADGTVSAVAGGTFVGGVNSVDVYSRVVTGSGGYHPVYANLTGQLGQVPSSRRFKQDIVDAGLDRATVRQLRVVMYRYTEAVLLLGEDARVELGVIAEEVHVLGLTFLVDYDEDGVPFGINDRAMTFVAVWLAQDAHARLDELEHRLA